MGPGESDRLRVAVVDDHPLIAEGVAAMFGVDGGLELVGQAAPGEAALQMVRDRQPDVVLLDVGKRREGGLAFLRQLKAEHPDLTIVLFTGDGDFALFMEGLRQGASAYLPKASSRGHLLSGIRAAACGSCLFPRSFLERVLEGESGDERADDPGLSARETEILQHLANGESNREIGRLLHLTESTVKKYVQSLTAKLGASHRTHAVALALRQGLIG